MAVKTFPSTKGNYIRGKTLKECRELAEAGDLLARVHLARDYSRGRGVPQDYAQARKWLKLAKAQPMTESAGTIGFATHFELCEFLKLKVADLKPTKIVWQETEKMPAGRHNGIVFYYRRKKSDKFREVASADDWNWIRGYPKTVTICCIPPDSTTTKAELTKFKKTIASLIHAKRGPDASLADHIRVVGAYKNLQWDIEKDCWDSTGRENDPLGGG